MATEKPIEVHFSELRATPNAIILVGTDNGAYQRIRDTFTKKVELIPNTKLPPKIIHSSLYRYTAEADLQPIADFLAQQKLEFTQTISEFRLLHETIVSMITFEILKTYKLSISL